MTVRKTAAITFTPVFDFMRIDRGIEWGVKVTDTGEMRFVSIFIKDGAGWTAVSLTSMDWELDMRQHGGSIKEWFVSKCLPLINEWLAKTFKPSDAPTATGTPSEQLDKLIVTQLRVTVQPDGTLIATMP